VIHFRNDVNHVAQLYAIGGQVRWTLNVDEGRIKYDVIGSELSLRDWLRVRAYVEVSAAEVSAPQLLPNPASAASCE